MLVPVTKETSLECVCVCIVLIGYVRAYKCEPLQRTAYFITSSNDTKCVFETSHAYFYTSTLETGKKQPLFAAPPHLSIPSTMIY